MMAVPDRPRLDPGWSLISFQGGVALRTSRGGVPLGEQGDSLLDLLAHLDGKRDLVELLGALPAKKVLGALALLGRLAMSGLLGDGPPPSADRPASPDLSGLSVALLGDGSLAGAVAAALGGLGAGVYRDGEVALSAALTSALFCPERLNFAALQDAASRAREAGLGLLPVLPFGDAMLVGPILPAGGRPCPGCLIMRWLALAPSPEIEAAFLEAARLETIDTALQAAGPQAAAQCVLPFVANLLSGARAGLEVASVPLAGGNASVGTCLALPACRACGDRLVDRAPPRAREDWDDTPLPLDALRPPLLELARGPCALACLVELRSSRRRRGREVALSRFADPNPLGNVGTNGNWCHGAGETRHEAETVAVIEALERYCGLAEPPPAILASYRELGSAALDPVSLPLYSPDQYALADFPHLPFDPDQRLRWSFGYNLSRGQEVLVPTGAVWYALDDPLLTECSSGIAAHGAAGAALLNAALELVERDAFMIHWLHRLAGPNIARESLGRNLRAMIGEVESAGYSLRLIDITTDLDIPVALALGIREDGLAPALIVGAGASLEAARAVERALGELVAALDAPGAGWRPERLEERDVRSLADHSLAYAHPEWLSAAEFLWSSARTTACAAASGASQAPLDRLLERFEACGHELIGVEMTTDEVRPTGLHVIRALAPGLVPLAIAPAPRLGGERLYQAPARMGYSRTARTEAGLYVFPHCFP